ncbi:integrase [Pseudomonas sp. CFBP13528]|uniref:phage integrase n=1 Tax=Pseudomonas sp. CFBP13528 TaxID=2184006 RepID=UPI0010C06E4D|nr:tyrosine-type recombinase/integrase [Pseudomonas sp. CFBP13528]TKK29533.1 integrase [Pseudomonas sp. CFBP13528]
MRPRKTENRDLPPGMVRRKRPRKNGTVWVGYYYRDANGKELSLGGDLDKARLKWAELEAKAKPADLKIMRGIFDRYERDIIPKKAPRTQKDNKAELKHLRNGFEGAPIDAITPSMVAQYRDARTAKTRANREIALLSHVFNMAREWGFTDRENPCAGVRKNKEKVRDYYANDMVWAAVYEQAPQELKDAMDLAYLTGQRPADVIAMKKGDVEGDFLTVQQGKTSKRLRIQMQTDGVKNSLGLLIDNITARNKHHISQHFVLSKTGMRVSQQMLRNRWDDAREKAVALAASEGRAGDAEKIRQFQFKDIRPKAASEITDIADASLLLGHSEQEITKRVYRRIGAVAQPSK